MINFKNIYFLFLIIVLITLSSCNNNQSYDIITTLYPQYDIAKQISGDKLSVKLIVPFGTEVHDYEPTAKDMINIKNSKLFIYTSTTMEPWVTGVTSSNSLDLSKNYETIPYIDSTLVPDNIHFWTDPLIILQLIRVIEEKLVLLDEENASTYHENADKYYLSILSVHEEMTEYFTTVESKNLFFYGHNAMGSFAGRYDLTITALTKSYKPDSELTPHQILNLKEQIKIANTKYLFVEELINLKGPTALKSELSKEGYEIEILELHGFHNISSLDNKKGVRYVDLLKRDFENIKKAVN